MELVKNIFLHKYVIGKGLTNHSDLCFLVFYFLPVFLCILPAASSGGGGPTPMGPGPTPRLCRCGARSLLLGGRSPREGGVDELQDEWG